MHEQITRTMYYFGVHLLFASLVCLAAWVLTSVPRGRATTKYWIWVATALNFISPLGALVDEFGQPHLSWARPLPLIGSPAATLTEGSLAVVLFAIWFGGAALMFTRLCLRLRADHRNAGGAHSRVALNPKAGLMIQGVPVRFSEKQETPAVDGLLRPSISLPSGIDRLLNREELDAVLVHELRHAKRRDNLIRLIFEMGRCVLWFHPLIWVAGTRLALYRELSCDESVIQSARGEDLISALAKLAGPEKGGVLLQATASSLVRHRISHLAADQEPASATAGGLLAAAFCVVLLAGIFETVAHTACCFMGGH